jgi:hypothetical protein
VTILRNIVAPLLLVVACTACGLRQEASLLTRHRRLKPQPEYIMYE